MKPIGTTLSILVLAGGLASGVSAADNYALKEQTASNYCHMKFPAISERTLFTNHPRPKSATAADVIDYYGSCDESATSKDEIATQRLEELRDWRE